MKLAVSKKCGYKVLLIELAGAENYQGIRKVILSNDTIKEQYERRRLLSRYNRVLMLLGNYQVTARGQLPEPHFY